MVVQVMNRSQCPVVPVGGCLPGKRRWMWDPPAASAAIPLVPRIALLDRLQHGSGCTQEFGKKLLVYVQHAFVFREVALLVAFVEYAPDLRAKTESVRQYLEDDVAMLRAEAQLPQRRETQGVGGIVGEIKAALDGVLRVLRILETNPAGTEQPVEFGLIGRFRAQRLARAAEIFKRRGHVGFR